MGKKKTKQTPKRSTFLYPHLYRARRLRKRNLPADVCLGKARGSFEVRKGHGPGLTSGERPEVDRVRSEFRGFALCHEVLESGSGIRAVVTVSLRNGAQKSLGGLDARRARSCESAPFPRPAPSPRRAASRVEMDAGCGLLCSCPWGHRSVRASPSFSRFALDVEAAWVRRRKDRETAAISAAVGRGLSSVKTPPAREHCTGVAG